MTVETIGNVTIDTVDEETEAPETPEVVEATKSEETPEAEAPEVESEADEIVLAGEVPGLIEDAGLFDQFAGRGNCRRWPGQ